MRPGWRAWAPVATLGVVVLLLGRAATFGAAAQDDDDTGVLDTELVDTEEARRPPMLDLPPIGPDLQPYLPGTRAADLPADAVRPVTVVDTEVPLPDTDLLPPDTEVPPPDTEVRPPDTDTGSAWALGAVRLRRLTVGGLPVDSGTPVVLELETPAGVEVRELRVLP